jgi:hypothetical protein
MTVNLKGRSIAGADGSQGHFAVDTVEIKAQPGRLGRGSSGLQGDAQYQAKPQRGLLQGGLPTEQMPVLRSDVNTLFLPLSFEGCTKAAGGTYSKPWYTQAVSNMRWKSAASVACSHWLHTVVHCTLLTLSSAVLLCRTLRASSSLAAVQASAWPACTPTVATGRRP